jgi:excisionase family DNA binding protein
MTTPLTAILDKKFLSLDEAAELIGVDKRTLRRRIASGELAGYRMSRKIVRVRLADVEALLKPIPVGRAI